MAEEEKGAAAPQQQATNVTEETYPQMLQDVIKQYEGKLAEANKQHAAKMKEMTDDVLNGVHPKKEEPKAPVDVQKLRNKLFNEELSNLEYAETALALRDELIARGETDPFLPKGSKIVPTDNDIECANRVADTLKICIDYAQGDSQAFTNELQRRTVDTGPMLKKKK